MRHRYAKSLRMPTFAYPAIGFLILSMAGCCCVTPGGACGGGSLGGIIRPNPGCGTSCVDTGPCGIGLSESGAFDQGCGCDSCAPKGLTNLAGLASCNGACGEVYYDEWINEPPTPDNCGYDCGGCGRCGQCRPLMSVLKLLWGRPYHSACDTSFLTGPSCGCDSCGGGAVVHEGHASTGCTSCQGSHTYSNVQPAPARVAPQQGTPSHVPSPSGMPSSPIEVMPSAPGPTSAPSIVPSSARRLNPAKNRRSVVSASYESRR